jgi:hypothetical protein
LECACAAGCAERARHGRQEAVRKVFGLPPCGEVDEGELTKAYHSAAMRCHPDKHPDDPAATTRFQQLSEAYSILTGPARHPNLFMVQPP